MTSRYRERPAIAPLRGVVRCVWVQSVQESDHRQRIIPDACIDLIWMNGELSIAGPDTRWRFADIGAGTGVAGIRLRPGAAPGLLGRIPASEVADDQVDAALLGIGSHQLIDRLAASADVESAAAELERYVAHTRTTTDPVMDAVITALDSPEPPSVPTLARTMGLSERQLRRRVTAAVGYGPKTLQRILRMERAVRLAPQMSAADVAMLVGYADQPHLTREFGRLAGAAPGRLFA